MNTEDTILEEVIIHELLSKAFDLSASYQNELIVVQAHSVPVAAYLDGYIITRVPLRLLGPSSPIAFEPSGMTSEPLWQLRHYLTNDK